MTISQIILYCFAGGIALGFTATAPVLGARLIWYLWSVVLSGATERTASKDGATSDA